jgi:hypothetical protein
VYFYVYYVAKIVAGIFCEGSMHCLSLAYVVNITASTDSASDILI